MSEWRKQQEKIQLTEKARGTTSSHANVVEGDSGGMMQPVTLEDRAVASVHGGRYNAYNAHPYVDHIADQGNYGAIVYPSNMEKYGQHQHQWHPHMHPKYSPQEQNTNQYPQDFYPSESLHRPQQQCRYLIPQQHESNSRNIRDLNQLSFPNNQSLSHLELHAGQ